MERHTYRLESREKELKGKMKAQMMVLKGREERNGNCRLH